MNLHPIANSLPGSVNPSRVEVRESLPPERKARESLHSTRDVAALENPTERTHESHDRAPKRFLDGLSITLTGGRGS
jgi:hypothetical protein